MRNMDICIIGGLGFVGNNLTEMLDQSNQITILDIVERPKYLSKDINYINCNTQYFTIFSNKDFDYIFYLVGNASVAKSIINPIFDIEKNTIQLINLLEAIKNKRSKLIFASSAACYGEMKDSCTAYIDEPISPYGISKLFSENYLKYYHNNYGIPILICRFFSLFGKYNRKQVVYDSTLRLLKHPDELTIYNPISERDFIYIKEAVNAMLFLCGNSQFNAEVFDIGRGKTISIIELTKTISNILKEFPILKAIEKKFVGDPKVQIARINKLENYGFRFETSTEENIFETINWIKGINI